MRWIIRTCEFPTEYCGYKLKNYECVRKKKRKTKNQGRKKRKREIKCVTISGFNLNTSSVCSFILTSSTGVKFSFISPNFTSSMWSIFSLWQIQKIEKNSSNVLISFEIKTNPWQQSLIMVEIDSNQLGSHFCFLNSYFTLTNCCSNQDPQVDKCNSYCHAYIHGIYLILFIYCVISWIWFNWDLKSDFFLLNFIGLPEPIHW